MAIPERSPIIDKACSVIVAALGAMDWFSDSGTPVIA